MKWFNKLLNPFKIMARQIKKINIETTIRESCLLAGFFMLGYGIWLIYPPASFVVCGLLLMWIGLPPLRKGGD